MTFIQKYPNIKDKVCVRCSKEQEIEIRNSEAVLFSIETVLNGYEYMKTENYYRLVNGTAPVGVDKVRRKNKYLVPSGKVLLDYDVTDWREKVWPKIVGKEKELGILQIEESTRGKLHITVRRIDGLTIGQTIEWFERYLDVELDNTKDLARVCFLVPMSMVLYVDEAYYDDFVEPQQQDISGFEPEVEDDWKYLTEEEKLDRLIEEASKMKQPDLLDEIIDDMTQPITTPVATPQPDNEYHRVYEEDEDEFQRIVNLVVKQRIDLCPREPEWFRLAIACYCVLGEEDGRVEFHRLSQFYPRYTFKETEEKYNHVARSMYDQVGLGSLIFWCKNAGVKLNEEDIAR